VSGTVEHRRLLARILLVDDDLLLRKMVRFVLTDSGYDVTVADGASAAMHLMERDEVHLIILDVGLNGMSGLDLCRHLRARGATQPVLFLSGHKDLADKMAGFDAGGDDYLAKPFEPRELLARVRALLSRQFWGTASAASSVIRFGDLALDLTELSAQLPGGRVVSLTPTELRVLQYLMVNAGRVVTRDLILQAGWGYNYESASNQVDVYIRRIRRKIEGDGSHTVIQTVRGLGYRLVVGSANALTEELVPAAL
jgi:two-component system, OmpR family, response regulator MprA